MEIFNADFDIDILEFCDRFGNIRSTSGCSFRGKIEFDARMKLLQEIIKNAQQESHKISIIELYQDNKEFAHHCDHCLELNGIETSWLTEKHLVNLLFVYQGGLGMLVRLNAVNNQNSGKTAQDEGGKLYHQVLGALFQLTRNPQQTFDLAENRPFKEVMGLIETTNQYTQTTRRSPNIPKSYPQRKQSKHRKNKQQRISDQSRITLMAMREKTKGLIV